MPLITDDYLSTIKQVHKDANGWGVTAAGKSYWKIKSAINFVKPATLLDYGAGAGRLKERLSKDFPDLRVYEYEPARDEVSGPGYPSDLVVCIDVLEHIEPECLKEVLIDLQRCVLNKGYITVAMYKASRILPDGRNAHLIIKDLQWWKKVLSVYFSIVNTKEEKKTAIFFVERLK